MTAPLTLPDHGFGAAGLGNLGREVASEQAQETLATAWARGLRYFDTSPLYGFGLSELRVGQFLRDKPRADFVLSTKVGRYMVPPRGEAVERGMWTAPLDFKPVLDYSYDGVMRSLEQSYSRLGLNAIDIAYIHDLDRRNLGADFDRHYRTALEGAYRALDALRASGDVKAIGLGINEADVAADFMAETDLDLVMLAGRYSLIEQGAAQSCFPVALEKGVGIVAVGVYNSGVLAKPGGQATYDYHDVPAEIAEKVRTVSAICDRFGVAVPAVAARFPSAHPAVASVVFGMTRPESVNRTMDYLEQDIPAAIWPALKEAGIVGPDIPTPDIGS